MTNTLTNCGGKPEDGKTRIEIFTDGSAIPNPGPSGWGFVALLIDGSFTLNDKVERKAPLDGRSTNIRAEMTAVINALHFVAERQASGAWRTSQATIISDSQTLVKGFTEWLPGWTARGWCKSNGKPVENRDLWEQVLAATEGLVVEWHWIEGHSGIRWNERADALAKEAAEEAQYLAHFSAPA